jgi:hypothetical protein
MDTTNEPVAWLVQYRDRHEFRWKKPEHLYEAIGCEPLYTHPNQHDLGIAEAVGFDRGYQAAATKTPTDDFINKNHMGYVSPDGAFYAPDYPTWKQDGFTPVYREPVAKTLTDAEFDNIFANGKRLGVLETEDRFRKAMNLTDEEITEIYNEILIHDKKSSIKFARAILRKATQE